MGEGYWNDIIDTIRPINEPGAGNWGVAYLESYQDFIGYVHQKTVIYRTILHNVNEIMMPNRALTAVFSLNAGLLMGGIFSAENAALGSLAIIATYGCGAVYNNIKDIEADKINSASRPLASGALSVDFAKSLMLILASLGIALGYLVSPILAAACLLEAFLGVIYSKFTKGMGILAYATLVTTHMIVPLFAGAFIAGSFGIEAVVIALFLYLTEILAVSIKDYKDIDGDRETGLKTLPIIFGPQKASRLTFVGLCLPLVLVWIPWALFGLSWVFLAIYLTIGVSRFRTGWLLLEDQSPAAAGEALNSFRLITTLEMFAWCLCWFSI